MWEGTFDLARGLYHFNLRPTSYRDLPKRSRSQARTCHQGDSPSPGRNPSAPVSLVFVPRLIPFAAGEVPPSPSSCPLPVRSHLGLTCLPHRVLRMVGQAIPLGQSSCAASLLRGIGGATLVGPGREVPQSTLPPLLPLTRWPRQAPCSPHPPRLDLLPPKLCTCEAMVTSGLIRGMPLKTGMPINAVLLASGTPAPGAPVPSGIAASGA